MSDSMDGVGHLPPSGCFSPKLNVKEPLLKPSEAYCRLHHPRYVPHCRQTQRAVAEKQQDRFETCPAFSAADVLARPLISESIRISVLPAIDEGLWPQGWHWGEAGREMTCQPR